MNGGIMFGYALRIQQLDAGTIAEYNLGLDLGEHDPRTCVAVFGEDMGVCLACVIDLGAPLAPELVWADRTVMEGVPLFACDDDDEFALALSNVLTATMPHLRR